MADEVFDEADEEWIRSFADPVGDLLSKCVPERALDPLSNVEYVLRGGSKARCVFSRWDYCAAYWMATAEDKVTPVAVYWCKRHKKRIVGVLRTASNEIRVLRNRSSDAFFFLDGRPIGQVYSSWWFRATRTGRGHITRDDRPIGRFKVPLIAGLHPPIRDAILTIRLEDGQILPILLAPKPKAGLPDWSDIGKVLGSVGAGADDWTRQVLSVPPRSRSPMFPADSAQVMATMPLKTRALFLGIGVWAVGWR